MLNVKPDLSSAQLLLSKWQHLPYRSYFTDPNKAVTAYINQFPNIKMENFSLSGELSLFQQQMTAQSEGLFGLRYLPGESEHFGISMGRMEPFATVNPDGFIKNNITNGTNFLREVLTYGTKAGLDHISTAVAPADSLAQLCLQNCGFHLADTILGYHINLAELTEKFDTAFPEIREAELRDLDSLLPIAAQCFSDRTLNTNRFNSEPALPSNLIGGLYASWLNKAIIKKEADLILVYEENNTPVGFMTFRLPSLVEQQMGFNVGRAILTAVDPNHQRKGIYRKLLIAGSAWLKQRGAISIEGKTQLSTEVVLHVWQSLGGKLRICYHTFHYSS